MKDSKLKSSFQNKVFRNGGYSAGLTFIVLAVLIAVNLLIGVIPSRFTEFDMSPQMIYEIGDTSREVISGLDKDVEISVIAEESSVDTRISNYLERYAALSGHLSLQYYDPVLHPEVLNEFGVEEDTIVVSCEDTGRSTNFTFDDVIVTELNEYYYYYYGQSVEEETEFDGEGLLTSAIASVTSTDTHVLYNLTGHGETELSSEAQSQITKSNIEVKDLDLIGEGSIPEDAEAVMIHAPSQDISEDEAQILLDYLADGGKLIAITALCQDEMPHLNEVFENYGFTVATNMYVADTKEGNYYSQQYVLLPEITDTEDTLTSLDSTSRVILNIASPIELISDMRSSVEVTTLMSSSEDSYKVSEDGQEAGQYAVAVHATETVNGATADVLCISSDLVNEQLTSNFANASNLTAFTDCVTSVFENISNISIEAKSLEVTTNTVTNSLPLAVLFIGLFPLAFLVGGFVVWFRRRKR